MKVYRKFVIRIGLAAILFAALALAYVLSFRSSYLLSDGGSPAKYSLVVCGLHLPYNSTTEQVFSTAYRPLIEMAAATAPVHHYRGVVSFPTNDSRSILVKPQDSDVGIDMNIPGDLQPEAKKFVQGQQVEVICGSEPMPGQPFCLRNKLVSITATSE
jgi:hypothetical protein